ncbi:MAG TPA: ATP-binding protein [Gammaproteobacteria bacterium]|nr:ATP-binding protein [Gammaproteobacteria bacterium]
MRSLQARLVLAASLVLTVFLGVGGFALDRSFHDSAKTSVRQRLQAHVYALLAAADVDSRGMLHMPASLSDERLQRPGSGLYAQVEGAGGAVLWRSASELGKQIPAAGPLVPGRWAFARLPAPQGGGLFMLSFGVAWDTGADGGQRYTFTVAEDVAAYQAQVDRFRRSLVIWLGAAAGLLLLVQGSILRWSLAPLRAVERELQAVEAGAQSRLEGAYPRELKGLTGHLNALLESERRQLARYRDALADLAHSLKTPLAVLRGALDPRRREQLESVVREQADRMNTIVDYQLQRAATSGRTALMAPVNVASVIERVVNSLHKVYRDRDVQAELRVADDILFHGDEDDLMELAGNLADNAFKWCRHRVRVSAHREGQSLLLAVEDDGPGIPAGQRDRVLDRGGRADAGVSGHGIGLAVVADIVTAYGGTLRIETGELGGARVCAAFPGV